MINIIVKIIQLTKKIVKILMILKKRILKIETFKNS